MALNKQQIIDRILAAGKTAPENATVAILTEFAAAEGISLVEEKPPVLPVVEEPAVLPGVTLVDPVDDVTWRVESGLTYPQALEAAKRQAVEDAASGTKAKK